MPSLDKRQEIFTDALGMKCSAAKLVLKFLAKAMWRGKSSGDFNDVLKVITNETLAYGSDIETKNQSSQW